MKGEINTVIWDCDGVLWFYIEKKEEVQKVAESLSIPYSLELEDEYFYMLDMFLDKFSKTKLTMEKYYCLIEDTMPILQAYNISAVCFVKAWNLVESQLSVPNEDAKFVLKCLSERGIKNVVRTDWWRKVQIEKLRKFGLLEYIDEVHTCEEGYLKSHPAATAEKIIKPGHEESCILVGDNPFCDISFAIRNKIKSIWFNREGTFSNETSFNPDYEIESLKEIIELV